MSWLTNLLNLNTTDQSAYPDFWKAYLAHFDKKWSKKTPLEELSFVVFDTETTGLKIKEDQILSIGAIRVGHNTIHIGDEFECFVYQSFTPIASNIEIHEILPSQPSDGLDEASATKSFLEFIGNDILVGHHVGFDVAMVNQSLKNLGSFQLKNYALDTGVMAKRLKYPSYHTSFTLDQLCKEYRIKMHDRHNAAGDAMLTAILFLKLLGRLKNRGVKTLGDLLRS
jgi:DNA polymerase-3 subunit epsilon